MASLIDALTLDVSRGVVKRHHDCLAVLGRTLALLKGKSCKKGGLDGCLLPIMFPMTVGLGENTPGALNALVSISASGGGRRPCARGLSIRTSLFRIRWSLFGRASADSRDPFSVFKAMVGIVFW